MLEEPPPELDMSSAFTLLGDAVTHRVLAALAGSGLRPGHGYVIQRLLTGPATATEIADELGVSQQAVSKSLKELTALGHVESVTGGADRRRRPARLTPAGRRAVETARATRRDLDWELREALGPDRFDATMAALLAAMEAMGMRERVRRRAAHPPGGAL